MRKLLLYFLSLFLLLIYFSPLKNSFAQQTTPTFPCTLSAPVGEGNFQSYDPGNTYLITIKSTNNPRCFVTSASASYKVFASPSFQDLESKFPDYLNRGLVVRIKNADKDISPIDSSTLKFNLDLASSHNKDIADRFYGQWQIRVCASSVEADCSTTQNLVGIATIQITPPSPTGQNTPPKTIRSDIPYIKYAEQPYCTLAVRQDISLRVWNIDTKKQYFWWTGNIIYNITATNKVEFTPIIDEPGKVSDVAYSATIPISHQVAKPADIKLCIGDSDYILTHNAGQEQETQNCIYLTIKAAIAPGENTSCTPKNSANPEDQEPTPTPTPEDAVAPCSQWGDKNGNPYTDEQLNNGFRDSKGKLKVKENNLRCIGVDSGIGTISTDPKRFVTFVLGVLLSVSGGIAIILIIVSGYRFMTSQGNPEALQAARDQLVSAIVGLLFIIFSLVILQVIGVDILHIPGFG